MIKIYNEDIQKYKPTFADRIKEFMGEKNSLQWSKENGILHTTVASWTNKASPLH